MARVARKRSVAAGLKSGGGGVLSEYLRMAMRRATYELIEDGTFWANIPEIRGTYGNAATLEGSREELQSALENWIVFGLRNGFEMPVIEGIDLNVARTA